MAETTCIDLVNLIELIAISVMPISVIAIIIQRVKNEQGIGVRAIQFLAVAMFIPLVLILAIRGLLDKGTIAALLGSLIGYLLSNIGEYDKSKNKND